MKTQRKPLSDCQLLDMKINKGITLSCIDFVDSCFQHHPLSQLIKSTQDCNYHLDNKGKHITTAKCREEHYFVPLSHA